MPRLGVLELPPVLQKCLVAHHNHMALAVEVQVRLIVLAAGQGFDGALGVADLQMQGLFDEGVDRLLGNRLVQSGDQFGDEVVDVEDHPFAADAPHPFDAGNQGAGLGLDMLQQRAFQRELGELDHFGAYVIAQVGVGFVEADDAAQLKLNRVGRQHEGALAMDFLREPTLLQLLDGPAHGATAGLVGVHQFGFGGQARAALQAFGGDAGKQIGVDLVVFTHGEGSVPRLLSRQEP